MKKLKKLYYVCFNAPDGCFPQKDLESFKKSDVQKYVNKLNKQDDNPYGHYCVSSKMVYVNVPKKKQS